MNHSKLFYLDNMVDVLQDYSDKLVQMMKDEKDGSFISDFYYSMTELDSCISSFIDVISDCERILGMDKYCIGSLKTYMEVISDNLCPEKDRGQGGEYDFYLDRIFASLKYGESAGMEIIKTVCRCAFNDEVLTEQESISIINICHSPEWHKIFMEVNYNEGWN